LRRLQSGIARAMAYSPEPSRRFCRSLERSLPMSEFQVKNFL